MLTARQFTTYADFFARLPAVLAFVSCMSFAIEYLRLRGALMVDQEIVLKLHQQRAANLRAAMLLIEMGAGVRVDVVVEEPVQPVKDGAA